MTFVLDALRDRPQGIFQMDDTSPLQDYSGYNRTAVINGGTPEKHVALVKGAAYAPILTDDQYAEFSSNVFKRGEEDKAFTLSAAVRAVLETKGYTAQPYRENYATNPSAESVTNSWSVWPGSGGAATTTRETSGGVHGTGFIRGTWSNASATNGDIGYSIPEGFFTPGDIVSFAIYVRANTNRAFAPGIQWQNSAGAALNTITGTPTATIFSNTWTRLAMNNIVVPEGAVRFKVMARAASVMASGDIMDADAVIVEKASVAGTYFDGSMTAYEWAGTPYASISRSRKDVSAVNMVNQDFGTLGAGVTLTPNVSYAGKTWKRLSVTNAGTGTRVYGDLNNFVTGEYFTASALVANDGPTATNLTIDIGDMGNTNYTIQPGEVVRVYSSATRGWNSTYRFFDISLSANTNILVTEPMITPGQNVTHTFFDGNSDGAGWEGAANSSVSILFTSQTEQQILGNLGQMDGLLINGNEISFVTKYANSGEARCSYYMQHQENALLHGIHTAGKNALYLNGELVAEVELTEAQQNDTFAATTANLVSGKSESGHSIAVNAVAFYPYALGAVPIKRQYRASRNVAHPDTIASVYGGAVVPLSKNYAQLFIDQHWNSDEDWNLGMLSNVSVVNDEVVPQFNGEVSVAGYWYDSVALDAVNATSIYGVALDWEGEGVTVQVSLTGTSWETVERGRKITSIAPGYNPTSKVLLVRAHFPGGIASDQSYLANLNVYGILSSTSTKLNGRTVTYNNATPGEESHPWDLSDNGGITIGAGGNISVSTDTTPDAQPVSTVEIWFKPNVGKMTRSFTIGAGAAYLNGTTWTAEPQAGKWNVAHLVLGTPLSSAMTFSGEVTIGRIVLYPTALTAAQVAAIHGAQTGTSAHQVIDSSIISITESGQAADIYAYDWEITGAG